MSRSWPPNPRDPKHRGSNSIASHLPVTILLILMSVLTGSLTRLGDDKGKGDLLFMSSQKSYVEDRAVFEEYLVQLEKLGAKLDSDSEAPVSTADLKEMTRWAEAVTSQEARLRNRDPLADIKKGQVWRLFTPMFLHFGILHLAFNMMWLLRFGTILEIRFRPMKFLGLVLAVAAISCIAQGFWKGTNFGGMSGVNYGLFGFIWLRSKLHPAPEFEMDSQTVAFLVLWMVVCCFSDALGPVANAAHLAGFFGGALIGTTNAVMAGGWKIFRRRQKFRSDYAAGKATLHKCATCGKTERDDSSLEFYVSSTDDQEYCQPHLPENQK